MKSSKNHVFSKTEINFVRVEVEILRNVIFCMFVIIHYFIIIFNLLYVLVKN